MEYVWIMIKSETTINEGDIWSSFAWMVYGTASFLGMYGEDMIEEVMCNLN